MHFTSIYRWLQKIERVVSFVEHDVVTNILCAADGSLVNDIPSFEILYDVTK